jgi:beta-glucosidase
LETLPVNRVKDLINQMTLDEKINYLGGTGFVEGEKIGETQPLSRLGIPVVKMTDATSGSKMTEDHILFPAFICLAATFNPELSESYGLAVAEQSKADGYRVLLGPGVNMYRVPHCGRNFEYLGEDPYLACKMLVPYIKSVQDAGVIATVKHFVANNSEHYRKNSNSVVSERALREIYYPAFKAAIQQAGVKAVMTSYNLLNGEWVGHSYHLITNVLRNEWGFDGMVMTDWWSIYDTEKAIKSGLDLEMPSACIMNPKRIKALLDKGTITEELIDQRLMNILKPFCEMGLLDEDHPDPSLRKK